MSVFSESYGRNDLAAVAARSIPAWRGDRDARARRSRCANDRFGSRVFAACESEQAARRAVSALPETIAGRAAVTLARHPLAEFARSASRRRQRGAMQWRSGRLDAMAERDSAPFAARGQGFRWGVAKW